MTSITSKRVNEWKESLLKFHDDSSNDKNNTENILDILSHLDKCPMDLNILAATLIGATVSKFKTSADANVAAKAKLLVKKWKKLAKQSGISNRSSSSSSKSASQTNDKKSTPLPKSSSSSSQVQSNSKAQSQQTPSNSTDAFNHLDNARKNSAIKLNEVFLTSKQYLLKTSSSSTEQSLDLDEPTILNMMITRSKQVEAAIQTFSKGRRKIYNDKIRSIIFNLKKNEPLRRDIILGNVSPEKLVQMSAKELQTAEKAKQQEEQVKSLQGSRRLDWEQANAAKVNEMCGIKGDLLKASLFTCGRCGSHKTTSTQKQTRSADEPMTVFVFCENCGNRWKC